MAAAALRPPRRSTRMAEVDARIDTDLLAVIAISQDFDFDPDDLPKRFETFTAACREAPAIIARIRASLERTPDGRARRAEIEEVLGVVELQLFWIQSEVDDIVGIIRQAAQYTEPGAVGRRPGLCAVCMDPDAFRRGGRAVMRHCGTRTARHVLCGACFVGWYIQNGESTAPCAATTTSPALSSRIPRGAGDG